MSTAVRQMAMPNASDSRSIPNTRCTVALVQTERLGAICSAQWDQLFDSALEDNAFLARQVVDAHRSAFGKDDATRFLAVRERATGLLVGLIPMQPRRIAGVLPGLQVGSAINLYHVAGAPLVAKDRASEVFDAFLKAASSESDIGRNWAFPHIQTDGPFAKGLAEAADRNGYSIRFACKYSRPVLNRLPGGFAQHQQDIIGKKRTKDVERNLRRLEKLGRLEFERASQSDKVSKRVEQFLEMEHASWKGRAGTSFLSKPGDAVYARGAYAPGWQSGGATLVDSLLLDGEPIAISVNLRAGRTLFTPKCAFDETYRKYGPGLALEYKVIERFYSDDAFDWMDAATTEDGHVISSFWNGAIAMGTLVLGPTAPAATMMAALDDIEYRARKRAKALLRR